MAIGAVEIVTWLLFLTNLTVVYGYYCDSGKCQLHQYCCGDNICCASYQVWHYWYLGCGLILFLVLLGACVSFWRYRFYSQRSVIIMPSSAPYARLHNHENPVHRPTQDENFYRDYPGDSAGQFAANMPNYPPPPYSQVNQYDNSKSSWEKHGD